jgi:phosphopentomutase
MRAIFLIMDSLGVGAAPDADKFGDVGSNTLGHIAERCFNGEADIDRSGPLKIPHLEELGMGLACGLASGKVPAGLSATIKPTAAYGAAFEISSGKDTPSGHWELAGVPVLFDWGYFTKPTDTFPPELLETLVRRAGLPGYLGNCHASGTDIIAKLGDEHRATGKPIFYTSADSVFQIAAHEESFGLEKLYELCQIAHEEMLQYNICRVIARPFDGETPATYARTGNRHDYAVAPPAKTVLEKLTDAGGTVVSIGKIADIYAHCGITKGIKASGLTALWDATLKATEEAPDNSIVMTNFVDFDEKFGHRRDVAGYARGLELFDKRLPEMLALLKDDDILIISADHGCDPTWPGTEHTREHVPVLVYGKCVPAGSLGIRESFADVGQSLANWFNLSSFPVGKAFLE